MKRIGNAAPSTQQQLWYELPDKVLFRTCISLSDSWDKHMVLPQTEMMIYHLGILRIRKLNIETMKLRSTVLNIGLYEMAV